MARKTQTQVDVRRNGREIRVTVPGADTPQARKTARGLAMKAVGTVGIGALTSVDETTGGHTYAWHPSAAALAARKVVPGVPPVRTLKRDDAPAPARGGDDRLAWLERELARVTAALAEATGAPVSVPAPAPARELPAFLRKEPVACEHCRDFGLVRAQGPNAGNAYKTLKGAQASHADGRAKACTCKAGKAFRKGKRASA